MRPTFTPADLCHLLPGRDGLEESGLCRADSFRSWIAQRWRKDPVGNRRPALGTSMYTEAAIHLLMSGNPMIRIGLRRGDPLGEIGRG